MVPSVALPPGFIAVGAADPIGTAVAQAAAGADPGSVFHAEIAGRCVFAVVLAPEGPIEDGAVRSLGAQALHDALAGLAPVGLPIGIAVDHVIVNGAVAATLGVSRPPGATAAVPDWLVLWVDVAIDLQDADPGLNPLSTCLAEEGFTASGMEVMAAFCRHLLAGVDAWTNAHDRRRAA
jgi:hypothetical protein